MLYKKHPAELKFVLVDPKMVEFSIYAEIERHYLAKLPDEEKAIITDFTKMVHTLNSLCKEMDNRYELLTKAHVRNIKDYNEKFISRRLNPEKGHKYMSYIVVIIDEFGDLIMTATAIPPSARRPLPLRRCPPCWPRRPRSRSHPPRSGFRADHPAGR